MHILRLSTFLGMILLAWTPASTLAQVQPDAYTRPEVLDVLGLSVEGDVDEFSRSFVQQTSQLAIGQKLSIPGDPALSDAIRSIYRLGTYENVQIVEERRVGSGVFLAIHVRRAPTLGEYTFSNVKKGHAKDIRKEVPLVARGPVQESAVARSVQIIKDFYADKGHPLAEVEIVRDRVDERTLNLDFRIDKGPKVKVEEIRFTGNEQVSDRRLRKAMKTNKNSFWKFWKNGKLNREEYAKDMDRIVRAYNERGHYDARVLEDTVYIAGLDGGDPEIHVEVKVEEGPKYHIRRIRWEGNTLFSDAQLTERLSLFPGDVYNVKMLEENLFGVGKNNDVSSLYMNAGYMRFGVEPEVRVRGDSLDLVMNVFEGDVFEYGNIRIAGNTTTKEHVIRRELSTIPGSTFRRDQIQESVRRLMQLNYFTQESVGAGPEIDINDGSKTVDLQYNLEETGTSQLELSGTWGQFGLVLQLRFNFNNFSAQNLFDGKAWSPLPSGDGQQFSIGVQTNGSRFQQYQLSFTEPWFRGKPKPLGFSTSFSRIRGLTILDTGTAGNGRLLTFSQSVFYQQRLRWPDNWFRTSTRIGYQYFLNEDWISTLPQGVSQQLTITQDFTRDNTNHPLFPSQGSSFLLSAQIAPPVGDLIQFHKWRLNTSWYAPITRKISLSFSSDFGFIGTLNGEEVEFERFVVGGSPFETQGFLSFFGKDVIYMRGFPLAAVGPRNADNEPVGGRILNKYGAQLTWMAVQSQSLQAAPYLFMDAANAWDQFRAYNPTDVFRSAGFGAKVFLPILGMVEMAYGYNFDEFTQLTSGHNGSKKWTFQFSLGQGF